MTKQERLNWLINIENSAAVIEEELSSEVTVSVLERYGAKEIEDLPDSALPEVFSDLFGIEADLK